MGGQYMKDNFKKIIFMLCIFFLLLPAGKALAADASAISFGTIDYEELTLQIYNNNNTIVYYSTDNTTWSELEGGYSSSTKSYQFDISWVSVKEDVTLYFKGDIVNTVKSITLPMQNSYISVEYDKVEGEFTFLDVEESDYFEWRKAADYYWNRVSFTETSASYQSFLTTMESLRVKGAKIIIRTPQVTGTGASDVGMRPSAEVSITIPARPSAPSVKVNSSKLTLNTTASMEYYDSVANMWVEFDGVISVEDIAPKALYENGSKTVTLLLRKSATASAPYSKTQKLVIPGQTGAPTIGGTSSDVTYYFVNSKLVMQFNNASTSNAYEYMIVKEGNEFNHRNSGWKTVTSSKLMTLSSTTAPNGCTIYVRKKGSDENTTKNQNLVLSSAVNSFSVSYGR
jgi:hypothetical protein